MGIDKKISTHICNVIRRQIQSKFPDFTLVFILHEEETRQEAIKRESRQILRHPAGENILDYLRNADRRTTLDARSKLIGLSASHSPGLLGLFGQNQMIAAFFINMDRYETEQELRNHALHMTWHAIAIRYDYMLRESKSTKGTNIHLGEDTYEIHNKMIRPKLTLNGLYKRNLMADIFAASTQYLQGHLEAIREIAIHRMKETLIPKQGFIAERYPYPVSIDTLEFMLENGNFSKSNKTTLITDAIEIAQEIGENYTIPAVSQWRNFSHPAQHMAWLGFSPEVILGAAIYTSENEYVRSIADIVVDMTEIEPEIVTSLDDFNPFVNIEETRKMHEKCCHELWRKLMLSVVNKGSSAVLYEEARKQNLKLRKGNPYGWCASSLLAVAEQYDNDSMASYDRDEKTKIEKIFETAQEKIPYDRILRFSVLMFQRRRDGHQISLEDMLKAADSHGDFAPISAALEKSQKSVLTELQRAG